MAKSLITVDDVVKWKFQVEEQGFITRYGQGGENYYKQVVVQLGAAPREYPIKRISERVYETAKRLSASLK